MKTAWKGSLLSVAVAVALTACDQSPTATLPSPLVVGAPSTVATSGVRRFGRVLVASGSDADTLVRHTAARWAAQGNRALQTYVDTSRVWDGRVVGAAASKEPPPLPDDGNGIMDLSGMQASMDNESIEITLNGKQAMVVSRSYYAGSDAHTDLTFGANYADGTVDIPQQTVGGDDGHTMQKLACAADMAGGSQYSYNCMAWVGTITVTAYLVLSHDCGEYAYGSATSTAWFELPIPDVSLGTGGASIKLGWKKFGYSGPIAVGRKRADQPPCPKVIVKTPDCADQLTDEPSGCGDPSNGGMRKPGDGSESQTCTIYLARLEESYDGGVTWIVLTTWYETIC